MKYLTTSFAIVSLLFSVSKTVLAADNSKKLDIKITNAYIYVPLGQSKTTTAFFSATNNSNTDISIEKIDSNSASKIQLVPAMLLIPAHQTRELKPAASYLQVEGLKTSLSTGDEVQLTLRLSNGQKVQVIALAKSAYDTVHSR